MNREHVGCQDGNRWISWAWRSEDCSRDEIQQDGAGSLLPRWRRSDRYPV